MIRSASVSIPLGLVLLAGPLAAQCPRGIPSAIEVPPDGVIQEVIVKGDASYTGRVIGDGDPVRFLLLSGDVLELARERVRCIRPVEGQVRDGRFWHADPNVTRLFFGPTGRALPRGTGYLSVFEVVFPMLAVGVTDRVTLAGGLPLFFTSEGPQVMWFAPKVEVVRRPAFRAAAGVLGFFGSGMDESIGVLYAVGTFGKTTDRAVTVGAGWGYSTDDGIYSTPALMLGAESRASRRVKLISENYVLPADDTVLLSFGTRFLGDRLSADLGLAIPIATAEGFFTFPLVNFVYNW